MLGEKLAHQSKIAFNLVITLTIINDVNEVQLSL